MNRALAQARAIWKQLGVNQRVTIVLLVFGVIAGVATLVVWSQRPNFEFLFSDLEPADMDRIVQLAKEDGVPYRLANNGSAILVPSARKYELRMKAYGKGLVQGAPGLDKLGENAWTDSPDDRLMKHRALMQGELVKTITSLDQVIWANVQIAKPKESPFIRETRPVTAAITLRLRPGSQLSRQQIMGIQNLVAAAIEGLDPQNVTIIDSSGAMLTRPAGKDGAGVDGTLAEHRRSVEEGLMKKAQAMLDRVLGPDRALVAITAEIETQEVVQETNEIDPDSKVTVHESVKNKSSGPAGGAKAASVTADESSEVTYQFGRRISKTRRLPGAVKRLSVAAQVDPYFTGPDGKEAELSDKEMEDIAESIKNAVGFTAAAPRNDTFQLTRIRFHRGPAGTAFGPAGEAASPSYVLALRFASAPVALIIAFLFARMFMRRSRPVSRPVTIQTADGASVVVSADYSKEGEAKTAQEEAERQQKIELRRRVSAALKKDPAGAARLVQMWLRADK